MKQVFTIKTILRAASNFRRIGLGLFVITSMLLGCLPKRYVPLDPLPTLTPSITIAPEIVTTARAALPEAILGRWTLNHRRFANSILEFKGDGTLIISDSTNNQVRATMRYRFIKKNEIEITGTPEFQSTAALEFRDDKLCPTFIFEGIVFGEIYPCMTRIE